MFVCFIRFVKSPRLKLVLLSGLLSYSISACAPIPRDQPKTLTFAEQAEGTGWLKSRAKVVNSWTGKDKSTFAPLNDGHEGLGARLRLIEGAEYAIDLQYFLMKEDLATALILEALLDAADRGVRVRLLLDDIFTTTADHDLALLNDYPNVAVRLFNPSARPGSKKLSFLTDFSRINRRMHNKTLTADGVVSIIGGRNIADEYYQIDTTTEFADFDIVIVGPSVAEISKSFDDFWNDEWAVPMEVVVETPSPDEIAPARKNLTERVSLARAQYDRAVNDPYLTRLSERQEPLYNGHVLVVSDSPEKLKVPLRKGERRLAEALLTRFKNAQKEVVLITPYFVPEDYGARLFENLAQRGVSVSIVTNSLLSTNHSYVQAGYERHRERLLASGVDLYEIRADSLQVLGEVPQDSDTKVTMHTKLAIVDGETVFVGSMNFDPRSVKQNSEFGVFIESQEFARVLSDRLEEGAIKYTYRLSLAESGGLIWNYDNKDAPLALTEEPGRAFKNSTVIGVTRLLGLELQL